MLMWRRLWWVVVVFGTALVSVTILVTIGDAPGPAVIRVVGDDGDLWAYSQERGFLQGVDARWRVSRDAGQTWSEARPPSAVEQADLEQEVCNATACYQLVDGRIIQRQSTNDSAWVTEHERPLAETPAPVGEWRHDWDEERSIATADTQAGNTAVVAAGHDGVLVRSAGGSWHEIAVTRPWEFRFRLWLVAIGSAAILLVGLVGDVLLRRIGRQRSADLLAADEQQPERVSHDEHSR